MKKIKILFIVTNMDTGGGERYLTDIVNALDSNKYELRIVSLGYINAFEKELKIPITQLGLGRNSKNILRIIPLMKIIYTFRPQIIHTHLRHGDTVGQYLGMIYNTPIVVSTLHGAIEWNRSKMNALTLIEDIGLRSVDKVLTVSDELRNYIIHARKIDSNKITTLCGGVDLHLFLQNEPMREPTRKLLNIKNDITVFTCTARFRPEKRHDLLLYAFKQLLQYKPKCVLMLIGNGGKYETNVKELINALEFNEKVIICNGNREDVAAWLSASDVYVMHSETEGTSLSAAEAMASGLPVLFPHLNHFLVQARKNIDGAYFDFNSKESFCKAASLLIENPDLRKHYGENARMRAYDLYDINNHVKRLTAIYRYLYNKYYTKKH